MKQNKIRILIACEESDEVRGRFEAMGFDAWSCDLQPNRNPKAKHYQQDLFEVINFGWDAMIAFPPCTHLAVSGARHFKVKQEDGRQKEGIDFFMKVINAPIKHIAVENPIGIMSSVYRKPDQIIQPYYFGDSVTKSTCLWLKNLPKLYHNKYINLFDNNISHTDKGEIITFKSGKRMHSFFANSYGDSKTRSKTFPGIAKAMSEQWGKYLIEKYKP